MGPGCRVVNAAKNVVNRGALIVLEGCDRTGKTTQAKKLLESLTAAGIKVESCRFPDRSTKTGSIIDQYLQSKVDLNDRAIHLLFSANRWEAADDIIKTLESGTTLIVDRYAFSGVAFSAAKPGMALNWCKQSDVGLPQPDLVLFLNLSIEEVQKRGAFGQERYEEGGFQSRVQDNYKLLEDPAYWKIIDANTSVDELQKTLKMESLRVVQQVAEKEIGQLWVVNPILPITSPKLPQHQLPLTDCEKKVEKTSSVS